MLPGKLILLIVLVAVLGSVVFFLVTGDDPALSQRADDPSPAVELEEGDQLPDPVAEASNLIGKKLILFAIGGIAAGILILAFVVPAMADAVGTFFYSSAEESEPDPSSLAVAKIAQGDYEGAILEYRKLIDDNPMDRFPVIEVARLYLEKLENPDAAVDFLEESLNDKEWPVDDAAFLMFRIVEIELTDRQNPVRARELLTLIVENFEGTRHSANALHRIEQIDDGSWATAQ